VGRQFRKSDKNIGVDWLKVGVELKSLLDDVRYQVEHATYSPDEIAVRFHHRLVVIHPFPNGNGRHARMMADLLAVRLGQPRFTWGSRSLTDASLISATDTRHRYIAALQAADARDYAPYSLLPAANTKNNIAMTQILSREHRRILESTAAQARAQAESGAEKALKALAVGAKDAAVHATEEQKKLCAPTRSWPCAGRSIAPGRHAKHRPFGH
jgi:hypothetical protein